MFGGILERLKQTKRLNKLELQFKTADKIGATECQKCGFCCHRRACVPTVEELKEIAKFLKLTVKETIDTYMCIDKVNKTLYCVKPIGVNQQHLLGKLLSWEQTYNEGKCIFFQNNLCKIYKVRPLMAQSFECWDYKYDNSAITKITESWKNTPLETFYKYDEESYY